MTRPLKAAVAATLLALGLSLLLPTLAAAADAAPWVGTYKGSAVGKDAKGKKGTSGVTVWVEDRGDSTKFTFRFDKFPIIISQTAPNDGGRQGSMLMGISVEERGVSGAGLIVVYPRNGNYLMAGKGAGKAVGKQGTGRMGAVRTSTGVQLPSVTHWIVWRSSIPVKLPSCTGIRPTLLVGRHHPSGGSDRHNREVGRHQRTRGHLHDIRQGRAVFQAQDTCHRLKKDGTSRKNRAQPPAAGTPALSEQAVHRTGDEASYQPASILVYMRANTS